MKKNKVILVTTLLVCVVGCFGTLVKSKSIEEELGTTNTYLSDIQEQASDSISSDEVKRGSFQVVALDESDDNNHPLYGTRYKLVLKSDPSIYYIATMNEYGIAEFIDEEAMEYYPYTIPYGVYTLIFLDDYVANETMITISNNEKYYYIITIGTPQEYNIKFKSIYGNTDGIAGAIIKIWDCNNDCWVSSTELPSGAITEEYTILDSGFISSSVYLPFGEYIIYEIQAPNGHYLNEDLMIPTNSEDIGVKGKGGQYINLNKNSVVIDSDLSYYEVTLEKSLKERADLNNDNKLEKDDVLLLVDKISNGEISSDDIIDLDVNNDGTVDILDAREIMEKIDSNFLVGDIDKDGKLTENDAQYILGYVCGNLTISTNEMLLYCDMNNDNCIKASDAVILLQTISNQVIKGDLDRNGMVNANDAAVALDLYKYNNATDEDIQIGDIDENGVINANDAALILDIYKYGE